MQVSKRLTASQSYLDASPEVVKQVVNGCGPGGWKFDLIPDTIYGLSIKEVCNIHDWDYTLGMTEQDKKNADQRFLKNLCAIIDNAPGFWNRLLRPLRRIRANEYYEAVHAFGHDAFWANKRSAA